MISEVNFLIPQNQYVIFIYRIFNKEKHSKYISESHLIMNSFKVFKFAKKLLISALFLPFLPSVAFPTRQAGSFAKKIY